MTPEGLVVTQSVFDFAATVDRVTHAVEDHGMTVFASIDHAAGAAASGLTLRPTTVIIFGSARAGTPVMEHAQTAGIDLPLKALIWQDEQGRVWFGLNDPAWIVARHTRDPALAPILEAMSTMLAAVSGIVAGKRK